MRPAWCTRKVPGQPGLHGETLSQKQIKSKQTNKQEFRTGSTKILALRRQRQVDLRATQLDSFSRSKTQTKSTDVHCLESQQSTASPKRKKYGEGGYAGQTHIDYFQGCRIKAFGLLFHLLFNCFVNLLSDKWNSHGI